MPKNIVEAYIEFNNGLLIFISGLPGCGKLALAKNISTTFKINFMDQFDYYKKDYNNKVELPDGTNVINWYTDDAIDWPRLNQDIANLKTEGLVVAGVSFPNELLEIKPSYHVHLSISKQTCLDRRRDFLEKYKDKYPEEYKLLETNAEKLKMNQLIYPYYLEAKKGATINKFININELNDERIFDQVFDVLIEFIDGVVHKPNNEQSRTKKKISTDKSFQISTELLSTPSYEYDMQSTISDPSETEIESSTEYKTKKVKDGPIQFYYPYYDDD